MADLRKFSKKLMLLVLLGLPFGSSALGMDLPETVVLNSLSQYYDGAIFDHALHEQIADCAGCHHHTTGMPPQDANCARCHAGTAEITVVACRDCHAAEPFSAAHLKAQKAEPHRYHTDQLGLKGAYHKSCLGCHQAMGAPVGCTDCHARNQAGDKLFRADALTSVDPAASR
ncbi:cytochrome c3 family protein [Geoalkalibacter halelectricus]|uniref:cytochrome c3 family protein n=1 Tax=Geoalkalibacter halelectricus TaxID=2847045 RepID=UPI00266FAACB|nr:cytochrome c3 family protein [Geoalkalibacter halelectricus]MDO3377387.1 cytochrome c family protein [Geoalkalibacter halelectricus]